MSAFAMLEDDWWKLVSRIREERRVYWAERGATELCDCFEDDGSLAPEPCTDCAYEAAEQVPAKYHITDAQYEANVGFTDTLPGFQEYIR